MNFHDGSYYANHKKNGVEIYYEEAGTGFPLLVMPGGGLNATVAGLKDHAFNPISEFQTNIV